MSDFRSLLSNFQAATSSTETNAIHSSSSSKTSSSKNQQPSPTSLSSNNAAISNSSTSRAKGLRQCTERLWQVSNLRKICNTHDNDSEKDNYSNNANYDKNTKTKMERSQNEQTNDGIHVHIAICAVVVDSFPHETIWRRWMESGTNDTSYSNLKPSSKHFSDKTPNCNSNHNNNHNDARNYNVQIKATSEIYIHAKYPEKISTTCKSEWIREKTLPYSYKPNWNDVKVVRAMLALLQKALSDPRTTHILFCTESCIPITTLHEAALTLVMDENIKDNNCHNKSNNGSLTDINANIDGYTSASNDSKGAYNMNRSFINAYDRKSPECTRFDEYNCWGVLEPHIPPDAIWKALPGWIILSRKHATAVQNLPTQLYNLNPSFFSPAAENITSTITIATANKKNEDNVDLFPEKEVKTKHNGEETSELPKTIEIWPAFEKVWAPEEVYFPTALALTGHLPSKDIILQPLTHSKWDLRARDHNDRAHPKVYDNYRFTKTLVDSIRSKHSSNHFDSHQRNNDIKTTTFGCLFMRKFKKPLDPSVWERVVIEKCDDIRDDYAEQHNLNNTDYHDFDGKYSKKRQRHDSREYRYNSNNNYRQDRNPNRNHNYNQNYRHDSDRFHRERNNSKRKNDHSYQNRNFR